MSTVQEIKRAASRLTPRQRLRLYQWLDQSEDIRHLRLEALRRQILIGIKQADRGELVDAEVVVARLEKKIRRRTPPRA